MEICLNNNFVKPKEVKRNTDSPPPHTHLDKNFSLRGKCLYVINRLYGILLSDTPLSGYTVIFTSLSILLMKQFLEVMR